VRRFALAGAIRVLSVSVLVWIPFGFFEFWSGEGQGTHDLMEKPPTAPVAKQVVLVIDDDPLVLSSLKFSLEVEGFAVRAYSNPDEFLNETELPAKGDYYMPGMNGLELLARLRDRGVSAPAIVITGFTNCTLRERTAAAGVPLMEKPFLPKVWTERIRDALHSS
jgi:two-component system, LuxR family, response regulator FixJ